MLIVLPTVLIYKDFKGHTHFLYDSIIRVFLKPMKENKQKVKGKKNKKAKKEKRTKMNTYCPRLLPSL